MVSCFAGNKVCDSASFNGAKTCPNATQPKSEFCPTTLQEVGVYQLPSDTKQCMNKILCYEKLPVSVRSSNAFKCECVWSGTQSKDPMCAEYNKCLDSQRGENALMAKAEKALRLPSLALVGRVSSRQHRTRQGA